METVEVWEFDSTIKDYHSVLDAIELIYHNGSELVIRFDDPERIPVPDAKPDEDHVKPAYRYTFRFHRRFYAMRVFNLITDATIGDMIGLWIDKYHLKWPSCPVFRLTDSEFINWMNETDICGSLRAPLPNLVHYMFLTDDQLYDVVDDTPPIVEVEKIEY